MDFNLLDLRAPRRRAVGDATKRKKKKLFRVESIFHVELIIAHPMHNN